MLSVSISKQTMLLFFENRNLFLGDENVNKIQSLSLFLLRNNIFLNLTTKQRGLENENLIHGFCSRFQMIHAIIFDRNLLLEDENEKKSHFH